MKRVLSLTLVLVVLMGVFATIPVVAEAATPATFTASDRYTTSEVPEATARTFEAWISVSTRARAGIIVGNYYGDGNYNGVSKASVNFELREGGNPSIWWKPTSSSASQSLRFSDVDVATGQKLHLAVTFSTTEVKCYVNGELKQTLTGDFADLAAEQMNNFAVGGDLRNGNIQNFKGNIYSVAVSSDVKSADQIAADMKSVDYTSDSLLFAYDLTQTGNERLRDLSVNQNHLTYTNLSDSTKNASFVETQGLTFSAGELYELSKPLSEVPITFEATVMVPEGTGRAGVILANYKNDGTGCLNLELHHGGAIRMFQIDKAGVRHDIYLSGAVPSDGKWHNIAVVSEGTSIHCYVDGELAGTTAATLTGEITTNNLCVGGDLRDGNVQNFKGRIKSVSVYSDIRTSDEIKADRFELDTNDLVVAYDFTNSGNDRLRDLSGNDNHLIYKNSTQTETYVSGLEFVADDIYKVSKPLSAAPLTFEASVMLPTTLDSSDRVGGILANYSVDGVNCLNFELTFGGTVRMYQVDKTGAVHDIYLGASVPFDGKLHHVAVVSDGTQLHCYIDGVLANSVANTLTAEVTTNNLCVGGDLRPGNGRYFKGKIASVALYSDVRSATEIASDVTTLDTDNLILAYNFEEDPTKNAYEDLSGNGCTLNLYQTWMDSYDEPTDYAYSFAVIGDTQIVARDYPENFPDIYDWISSNVSSKNIKFVMGLGDITDLDSSAEWALAKANIAKLDGVVPYSLVRGNHDSAANFTGTFPSNGTYASYLKGTYDGNTFNSWQELIIGDIKYIIMALDYGASDDVLAWAGDVIAAHPEHNVIITTHAYLYRDGTTLDAGDVCPPSTSGGYNNGDQIWDKLVSKYENITLVLSGHDPCNNIVTTQTAGVNGNIVTQMIIDPQGLDASVGATGMVAMLYFSEDGKDVQVRYYSTVRNQYFMNENQFDMEIDVVSCAHNLIHHEAKAPTCTEEGTIEYWSCAGVCKKNFKDAAATEVATDLVVPKLGHTMTEHAAKAPTCTEDGTIKYWFCSACSKNFKDEAGAEEAKDLVDPKTAHSMTHHAEEPSTCIATGVKEHWACSECGKNYETATGGEVLTDLVIPAHAHTMTYHAATGNSCTESGTLEHWACSECGKNYKSENGGEVIDNVNVNALGHEMTHYTANDATCTEDGNHEYWACSRCKKNFADADGRTEIAEIVIPALGHDMIHNDRVAPTCTEPGTKEFWTCKNCNKNFADKDGNEVIVNLGISALGHDLIHHESTSTCMEAGNGEYWECGVCGLLFADEDAEQEINEIPAGEINDNHVNTIDDATVGHDEYSHWYECECGDILDTNEHDEAGTHGECSVCGYKAPAADTGDMTAIIAIVAIVAALGCGVVFTVSRKRI